MRTSSSGINARKQACLLLRGSRKRLPLSPLDRAFAQRLFRETVVWKKYLDHVLNLYTRQPVQELDQDVLRSLRIGAAQILILKTPAHAAVSATVQAHERHRTKGLVNAVLRKVALKGDREDLPLHVRYSHPKDLTDRWVELFGRSAAERLLKWNNSVPDLGGYAFGQIPRDTTPGRYLERYRLLARQGELKPGKGMYIQDEGAAVAGRGMAELPGATVLEIGAAPGGKTAHLEGTGSVFSVDLKPDRMVRWMENSRRLGWKDCMGLAADSRSLPFSAVFDKVIVDAPCTNTGVYRRRAEARWNWNPGFLEELTVIQRGMLEQASSRVAPGGVLVYSTCSVDPVENGQVVSFFEERSPGFRRIGFPAPVSLVDDRGFLSYFPPDAGIDGLFAAAWMRVDR